MIELTCTNFGGGPSSLFFCSSSLLFDAIPKSDSSLLFGGPLALALKLDDGEGFFFNAPMVATEFRKLFFGFTLTRDGGGVCVCCVGIGGGSSSGGALGTVLLVGIGPLNCPGTAPPY